MQTLELSSELRVFDTLKQGSTYFTDASSQTNRAVVVWQQDGEWQQQSWTQTGKSVQWLEGKAVQMALRKEEPNHINICTDSMYVYKLMISMKRGGQATSEIATLLFRRATKP